MDLSATIEARKADLDALRPLAAEALRHLQRVWDVELTYTSNAIEGNTLTLRETAKVIEHGITVGGKPLKDHLEAVDHHEAVGWKRTLAAQSAPIGEATVCEMHRRIVLRSEPTIAGVYGSHRRRIAGSAVVFPNPARLPALMADFGGWLAGQPANPAVAFDAHFRLTAIHPFSDGNGRTARLLMNLILLRGGYVPVAVRPVDRAEYLKALEHGSMTGDPAPFTTLLAGRLLETLDEYLEALREGRDDA